MFGFSIWLTMAGVAFGASGNVWVWYAHRRFGNLLIGIGALSNMTAMLLNGWQMPVKAEHWSNPPWERVHVLMTESHRVKFLCDAMPMESSIGDWIIAAGALWLISKYLWSRKQEPSHAEA